MKVRFVLCLLPIAVIWPSVALAQEASPNLVANGGFEELDAEGNPIGWSTWLKKLPEPNCLSVDETCAHSGKRSLRISHQRPTSYSMMEQRVTFKPGRKYVVSCWLKADKVELGPGSQGARLYVGKEGGNTFRASRRLAGTFDWRFVEVGPFDVGKRSWLQPILYLHQATGAVWFDDITFREVTEADMRRRAQRRARNRVMQDLDVVEDTAREIGAQDVLEEVSALRERAAKADDLPVTMDARKGPPYFDLHEQTFKLMARANRAHWAALRTVPDVYAHWAEAFSDVRALQTPRTQNDGLPWLVEMLRAETEQACVRLSNLTEAQQPVTLELTGLESSGSGEVLDSGKLTWRSLCYVETKDGQLIGDALPRIGEGNGPVSITLPPGMTQDVWLMIDSTDVEAGHYEGRITVTTADRNTQELLLSIIVYPLDFPEQVPIHTFAYAYTSWPLLKGRIEQSREDLVAHRINTYVIHGGFTPWPSFDEDGNWLGLEWTRMDEQIALHKNAKCILVWPGLELGKRVDRVTPEDGPAYPTEEWAKCVARWAKELATGMAERGFGYDQWALYLVDEPSARRAQIVRAAGDAVHVGDPLIRIFENPYGAATPRDMELMAPVVDIWCPSLSIAKDERLEFCRDTAHEVWMYQVLGKASHPLKSFRLAFWEAFEKDLRGFGFWDYADGGGSMWDAWDSERHDYAVVYDGDEAELIPSKRWEAYREGAEDFTLLAMFAETEADNARTLAAEVLAQADAITVRRARQKILRCLLP